MKKSVKNIIMIGIIALMIGSIFITINYAKKSVSVNNNMPSMNGTPPEMPNGNNDKTPPSKPGESENNADIRKEKRENKVTSSNRPDESDSSSDGNTPPEMPSNIENTSDGIEVKYYIFLGIESLVIFLIVIYLIMSKFNSKSFKETYADKDKLIITILASIILTGGFTYFLGNYVNNTNSSNTNSNEQNQNMPGGMNETGSITYSSSKEITSDDSITSGTFTSSEADNNAIIATGDINVNLSNIEVEKMGDSNGGDNTSFYGTNSAIIAKDGATLNITNATITTNATGANGVFSYGGSATTNNSNSDGTTVNISDSKITTTKDNSGGIMTTGGGVMNANNLEIETSGISSAAIRSDRGGGKVTVSGGTYKTTGQGSPTIYSTADITVNDATLIATASEGVVIEGKNSVTLNNCDLTDTNNKLNGQSTTYKNIFLYQSMSGDAASGNSEFTATNSKITTNNGDSFYVTNTTATINLSNNTITNNDNSGNFLRIKADSWGNSGSNGGDVTLNMTNQKVNGNIVVDNISTLNMTMKNNSYFEGSINSDNQAKEISLTIDSSSKIKLMADSYVTSLNDDTTYSNIDFNGYKLYVNNVSIN